jgi:hypothetical protein
MIVSKRANDDLAAAYFLHQPHFDPCSRWHVQALRVSSLSEEACHRTKWKGLDLGSMRHEVVGATQTEQVSSTLVCRSECLSSAEALRITQPLRAN